MLPVSIAMLLVSSFMAFSYHNLVESGEADNLTVVAYYVWLISIPVWLMGSIFNYRSFVNRKTEE